MKDLGDKISKVTSAMGIKPCQGCKKRAETLNRWTRRGFINGITFAVLSLRNGVLKAAWQSVGLTAPIEEDYAKALLQHFHAAADLLFIKHGRHHTKEEIFAVVLETVAKHRQHDAALRKLFPETFDPTKAEILPGWTFDYALTKTGWNAILKGSVYTFVTDKDDALFRVPTRPGQPTASQIESAISFPGVAELYPEHVQYLIQNGKLSPSFQKQKK